MRNVVVEGAYPWLKKLEWMDDVSTVKPPIGHVALDEVWTVCRAQFRDVSVPVKRLFPCKANLWGCFFELLTHSRTEL